MHLSKGLGTYEKRKSIEEIPENSAKPQVLSLVSLQLQGLVSKIEGHDLSVPPQALTATDDEPGKCKNYTTILDSPASGSCLQKET